MSKKMTDRQKFILKIEEAIKSALRRYHCRDDITVNPMDSFKDRFRYFDFCEEISAGSDLAYCRDDSLNDAEESQSLGEFPEERITQILRMSGAEYMFEVVVSDGELIDEYGSPEYIKSIGGEDWLESLLPHPELQ